MQLGDEVVGQSDASKHRLVRLCGVGHRRGGVHELRGAELLWRHEQGLKLRHIPQQVLGHFGDGLHVVGAQGRTQGFLPGGGATAGGLAGRLGMLNVVS